MSHVAIVDSLHHTEEVPLTHVVAGLSLIERAVRMAEVCGAERVLVATRDTGFIDGWATARDGELAVETFESVTAARESVGIQATVALLRSSTVYNRGLYRDAVDAFDGAPIAVFTEAGDSHVRVWRGDESVEEWERREDQRWHVDIETTDDAEDAADRLWDDCRKDLDGIVARYINRNISIAMSRILAPTSISPNQISIVTFALGIIAALLAAWGGWAGFAAAGFVFQANSVIDGVDGELARVRYEFSVTGEWLDTLSDDFSDVFFWIGLGIGAWRTAPIELFGVGSELWLWLAAIAVVFKLISMALYYTWLVAHGRGDLLAFTWAFDEDESQESSPLMKMLGNLKYLTKKDFIVFAAMIMGFLNILPYLLVAAAPGNVVVALSVATQRLANRNENTSE